MDRLDKPENVEALQELGEQTQIVLEADGRVFCDNEEISSAIRTEEVSALASQVSRFVPIRQALKFQQRQLVEQAKIGGVYRGAELEGRDIGTVVLPQADCKFFVEASPEPRARRRFTELQAKHPGVCFEEILEALKQRDEQDHNRSEAPLRKAADAILVDTSNLNVEQVLSVLEQHMRPFLLAEFS